MWLLPKGVTFEGYRTLLGNSSIWRGYLNTIYYTVLGTSINLLVTLPCAYALSEMILWQKSFYQFHASDNVSFWGLIPSYLLIRSLGMLNTVWALVIPGAVSVYNVVVTRTFFKRRSQERWKKRQSWMAARIFAYSCRSYCLYLRQSLQLWHFYGVGHWNSFFSALIYLSDKSMYPLQMILREILILQDMSSNTVSNVTSEMASMLYSKQQLAEVIKYGVMIVSSLPVIIVYPFCRNILSKA